MNVLLMMVKGDGTRRDIPLTKGRLIVGRTHQCDLRIPLPSVSRQHCEITLQGSEIKVRDLGSSNGTFHNGSRVQEATLKAGDELAVGPVTFRVVIDGQGAAPPTKDSTKVAAPAAKTATQGTVIDDLTDEEMVEIGEVIDEETRSPTTELDDAALALHEMAPPPSPDDSALPMLEEEPPKARKNK